MNPFWSEKLQGELDLRVLRPTNLPPVPGDDSEVGRGLDGEMELPISDREGSRKEVRGRLRSRDPEGSRLVGEGFETPASWRRHGKDVTPTEQLGGEVGRRSEGEMPYVDDDQGQSLERALEKELVSKLHSENQRLKKELEEMQLRQRVQSSRVTPSSWSAVTPEDEGGIPPPPPRRSRSPVRRGQCGLGDVAKYTPNGTRVPDGPPPSGSSTLPDLPAWPFGNYESCEAWAPCLMSMGSCWKGPLQDGNQRGGMHSRQELQGGHKDVGHGVQSRQGHQDGFQVPRDGMQSRQGEGHGEVMSAAAARAAWLERELRQLQTALDQEGSRTGYPRLSGAYWSERFQKGDYVSEADWGYVENDERRRGQDTMNPGGAQEHRIFAGHGRAHEHRALAGYGRAHEDRALASHGRAHEDRALASHGGAHEDRAFANYGRAHEDRALASHGRAHEDRVFANHGRAHEDRALAGHGRAHEDRVFAGHGREHEDRVSAGQGGDWAEHLHQADLLGDRVLHPHQAHPTGDRAWQLHHGGAGRDQVHGEMGADLGRTTESSTSATGVGGSQDQGGNHRTVELPELAGGDLTPLILGDWLEVVRPLMMDLSPQASRWWVLVVEEAYKYYHEWRKATPMERLKIVPESEVVKKDPTLHRTEQRGISLLLKAIPTTVKETVIAERLMTTTGILFTLLKNFQPGGSSERTMLLKELSEIKVGKSPGEACAGVRSWRRFYTRTKEIDATVPDPIILLKALEPAVQLISQLDAQATFRLAQSRAQLQVDARPDESSVWSYSECLLAELESLRLVHGASTMSNNGAITTTTPAVKTLGTRPTTTAACKFWGSEAGCKQGKACKFEHASLEDARDRCWNCSSTTHRKASCPYKTGGVSGDSSKPGQAPPGGSGKGGKSKTNPGGAPGGKNGKTSEKQSSGKPMINKTQTTAEEKGKGLSTSSTTATTGGDGNETGPSSQDQGMAKDVEKNGKSQSSAGTGEADSATLMSEVTSLLRSMRMSSMPQLSAISIKRLDRTGARTTLLDGGATHCLRPMANQREWDKAQECKVALATGSVDLKQVKDSGTLITQDASTQRIIPIRELVRMGVKIMWKNEEIEMTWQDGSKIPVWLDEGCPVIEDKLGKQIMEQIEANNFRLAGMKKIWKYGRKEAGEDQCDSESANEAMELSQLFPEVPHWLVGRIPGAATVDMSKVPFNRRQRRRLMEATTRVLHLFSGEHTRTWMDMSEEGLAVVCIEIEKGTNFLDDNLYAFLMNMAKDGLWDLISAGPPCRTVSLQRYREDGGPRPLRARHGVQRFGLSWNSVQQQEKCDQDSILWLRTIFLIYNGWKGNPKMETLIEQPSDPQIWLSHNRPRPQLGFASYLCWAETQLLMDIMQLRKIHFDQGAVGHEHVKPTTLLTNVEEAKELIGLRADMRQAVEWSPALYERMEESKKAAKWAPGIVEVLKRAIYRKKDQAVFGPRPGQIRRNPGRYDEFLDSRRAARERLGLPPLPDERMAIRAMGAKQLEDWKCHIANEHIPSRRDCAQCLRNMGRDRPHHRSKTPSAFCLNLDVAGPFGQGHDQCTGTGPRYFMVGVFTVPVQGDSPMIQRLQEFGAKVSSEVPIAKEESAGKAQLSEGSEESERERSAESDHGGEQQQPHGHQGEQADGEQPAEPAQEVDPWAELEQWAQRDEGISEVVVKELDINNLRWQEEVSKLKDFEVANLTFALPLRSRHASDILEVTAMIYGKLKMWGLPLHRVHTDRAREFTSRQFTTWLHQRDVVHTTTGGDEHQGCARAESEIGYLKARTRLLLSTAKAEASLWPLALRHAAEQRFRDQMASFGIRLPKLIPFGAQGMARFKRWHHVKDKDVWQHPMQRVTILGPAHDMSPTSGGYYVECNGRWMRSTVVIQPRNPQPGAGQAIVDEAELPDDKDEYEASIAPAEEDTAFDVIENDEGKFLEDQLLVDEAPQQSQTLKHRLHGKQTWPPVLRAIRTGGEWSGDESDAEWTEDTSEDLQEQQYVVMYKSMCGSMDEIYNATAAELLQLQGLRMIEEEEKAVMTSVEDAVLVVKIQKEKERMEKKLRALSKVEEELTGVKEEEEKQKETLVTRPVPLEEVRANLEDWAVALRDEYKSLINHGAIKPLDDSEYLEVKRGNEEVITIPGMLVATLKPPNRKKARVVACGNHVQEDHQRQDISAGGIDAIVTRTLVAIASRKCWSISTADVKTAFLQAPRRITPGKATVISPPSVLKEANILEKGGNEKWLVTGALYGLVESPKDWAVHRDAQLKRMRWKTDDGKEFRVYTTAEAHLWEVRETKSKDVKAYLGIYVDDIMVVGEKDVMDQVMQELKKTFYMSPYEEVTDEHEVMFCGFEIAKTERGYTLHQSKYIGELVSCRGVRGSEGHPLPKVEEGEDEEQKDLGTIRECQAIIGELQWLATRTRPDLCYATSLVARMIHRRPKYCLKLCNHILRYVVNYQNHGLRYEQDEEHQILHVRADTSFAPPHEQFRSVQGVAVFHGSHLLLRTSSRQAFVTLSTAESELVGYTEALQCGESVNCLLQLFGFETTKWLEGDSKAALVQLQSDGGSWRTRHLRLRASRLREAMADDASGWRSTHVPGSQLAADGLTKALQGQAHRKFVGLLEMDVKHKASMDVTEVPRVNKLLGSQCSLHDGALILATAGSTLVAGSSNQKLGVLLLICSVVVKWWERRKNDQKPWSNTQEPLGQKNCQDPEKRNVQDPKRTQKVEEEDGNENGAQKKEDPSRTSVMSREVGGLGKEDSQGNSWVSERKSPGLRAMRISKDEKDRSGAIAMESRKHGSSKRASTHGGGNAADGGYPTQNEVGRASSSGEGATRLATTSTVEVQLDQITEDMELRLHLRAPLHPGTTNAGDEATASAERQSGESSWEEVARDEPWKLQWYSWPPQGRSDRWDDALWSRFGWMVRSHGKERKQPFHPIHRSTPFQVNQLHEERITVVFNDQGKEVMMDHWQVAREFPVQSRWKGYTFFKKKSVGSTQEIYERQYGGAVTRDQSTRATSSTSGAVGEQGNATHDEIGYEEESDGSFIQVE